MLQTDEVDDDYFTPTPSTSLANIFGDQNLRDKGAENESLKYIPPKPQFITQSQKPEEDARITECVFACALFAHEWAGNVYSSRGKLGFAILKVIKNNSYNIVLYDSNKTTLSNTTITENLEMTVKENIYISYYDNLSKYWSVYGTEEEINKVVEQLRKLNVKAKFLSQSSHSIPDDPKHINHQGQRDNTAVHNESDTDSSINRRTKDSILSRMASMGHSVLPPHGISGEKTSDSSDTNTNDDRPKRHKPIKNIIKRINIEKHASGSLEVDEQHKIIATKAESSIDTHPHYTQVKRQLVPVTHTNIISSSEFNMGNDMSLFISEQRISNSELRINLNRVTDKVDQVLDKMKNLECADKANPTNIQTDILQKLIAEYEHKIKLYEEIMKSNDIKYNLFDLSSSSTTKHLNENYTRKEKQLEKVIELEKVINDQNVTITKLKDEINLLKEKEVLVSQNQMSSEHYFLNEIKDLKQALIFKDEEIACINKTFNETVPSKNVDNAAMIENTLKSIMNDTFRSIAANFDNDNNYSGENVKSIIATIIKKITLESLH